MRNPDQILSVAQMRAAEDALIAAGETVDSLMERAGRGAAQWVWRMAGGRPVTILCGPGNNGGDGYVIARELHQRGAQVAVIAPLPPATEAATRACASFSGAVSEEGAGGVLVDCLFGSGLTRPLSAELFGLLRRLAAAHHFRIAVDLPSGIESDTGRPLNAGLPDYHLTLALGAWKFAHWLIPAMQAMGARRVVDIGVTPVAEAAECIARPALFAPPRDAHKYTRGLLAVVGGAMPGAAMLAARAAMHGGAGYVKLLAPSRPLAAPDELVVEEAPLDRALADSRLAALLVGPGLGRDAAARGRLAAALSANRPTVVDADGLVLLEPSLLDGCSAPLLLTPHEGELARLCDAFSVSGDGRVARAQALARASGGVVVAKGPDTLVAAPDGTLRIAPPASSWLSTAGTGDVLAGLMASRLASGAEPLHAATEAVWLHGEAAHLAGPVFSAAGLVQMLPGAYAACL
nr:NAD(P)H-hydrate dehydratase [Altererythrobacter sp. B11]